MLACMISQHSDNFPGRIGVSLLFNCLGVKTNRIPLVGCIWMGNTGEPVYWYLIILSILDSELTRRLFSPFMLLLVIRSDESFTLLHHEGSLIFSKIILTWGMFAITPCAYPIHSSTSYIIVNSLPSNNRKTKT